MQTNVVAVALKSWFAIVGTKPSPCYCSPPEWHKKIPRFPEETGEGTALRQKLLVLDVLVDGLGDEILARTCLAVNDDVGVRFGSLEDEAVLYFCRCLDSHCF